MFGCGSAAPRTSPEDFLPWNPALHEPRVQPKRHRVPNCRLPPCPCLLPLMPGNFFAGAPAQESPAPLSTAGSTPAESVPCAWDSASLSLCPCSRKSLRSVWMGSEFERLRPDRAVAQTCRRFCRHPPARISGGPTRQGTAGPRHLPSCGALPSASLGDGH